MFLLIINSDVRELDVFLLFVLQLTLNENNFVSPDARCGAREKLFTANEIYSIFLSEFITIKRDLQPRPVLPAENVEQHYVTVT